MNATATDISVINVTALNEAELKKNSDIRITNEGSKITSLKDLFNVGRMHADYVVSQQEFEKEKRTNGTGYYDPLTTAWFKDEAGELIPVNSGVTLWDPETNRRIFLIVLEHGNNIVVHDRYLNGDRGVLTVSAKVNGQGLLNMNPCWSEGCLYDLIQCSNMFGFEFDRHANNVYYPSWRKDNWFKACRNQLIPRMKLEVLNAVFP